jgi:hypothetical protein
VRAKKCNDFLEHLVKIDWPCAKKLCVRNVGDGLATVSSHSPNGVAHRTLKGILISSLFESRTPKPVLLVKIIGSVIVRLYIGIEDGQGAGGNIPDQEL